MKFLIVGDLHGSKPNIYYKDFDAIIAPGDFCSDAPRQYMFEAMRQSLKDPDSKTEWYDLVGKKTAKQMILKSLKDGREILEQLDAYGVPVYIVPGNWDWTPKDSKWNFQRLNHYKKLTKGLKNIVDVHNRIIDVGEYQMIGHGISSGPEYPQYQEDIESMKPKALKKMKNKYVKEKKQ